jgi:hypothetical protein
MGVTGQHAQAALYPQGKDPSRMHWIGGWVGSRASLDAEVTKKSFALPGSKPWSFRLVKPLHWLSYPVSHTKMKEIEIRDKILRQRHQRMKTHYSQVLQSGGPNFKSLPTDQLFWVKYFIVFIPVISIKHNTTEILTTMSYFNNVLAQQDRQCNDTILTQDQASRT